MKHLICITALFLVVYSSPLRQPWVDLQSGTYQKNVGDIWKSCAKSDDKAKINNVKITPDPPQKGKNVEVNASITFDEEVTGGKIEIKAKYGIIPVYSGTLDLCDTLKEVDMECPIKKGDQTIVVNEEIPDVIPGGHYTGSAKVTDQNGNELGCIDLDIHL